MTPSHRDRTRENTWPIRLPWGWLVLGLAIIAGLSVSVISLTGYATPSFSICLTCHGAGRTAYKMEPKIVTGDRQCVEPREYMRARHMELLEQWKQSVVREGKRIYVASGGKQYVMSLARTCMACHWNKAEFCDPCHAYATAGYAKPQQDCWACHTAPGKGPGDAPR